MEKKQVSFRIDPALIKKLKFLAVAEDKSLTDLFIEAIHDLLKKYDNSTPDKKKRVDATNLG